jgi:plastocyanin
MFSRTPLTIGTLILVASTFVACGGGSSNSVSPTAPTATPAAPTTPSTPTTQTPAPPPTTPAAADVVIMINSMSGAQSYSPAAVTVNVGQTVAWMNMDTVAHTATADGGAFDTGTVEPGATSAVITMATAGSFNYHCAIHPSMTGSVTVGAGQPYAR